MSALAGAPRALFKKPIVRDYWYIEPAWCVVRLLEEVSFDGPIHDPGAGIGTIPSVARQFGYQTTAADIRDRGSDLVVGGVDFHTDWTLRTTIVCNPPSDGRSSPVPTYRDRFILHALAVAETVAMIVPVSAQCGGWRRDRLYRPYPPALILACGDRPSMPPGGTDIPAKGGTENYCWIVWRRGHAGKTEWRPI